MASQRAHQNMKTPLPAQVSVSRLRALVKALVSTAQVCWMRRFVLMMTLMRTINDGDGGLPPVIVAPMLQRISDWSCVEGALMGQVR